MVSHMNYILNVNEDFVIFLTSKFITCSINIHLHVFGTVDFKLNSFH